VSKISLHPVLNRELAAWADVTWPSHALQAAEKAKTMIRRYIKRDPSVLERLSWPEILEAARDEELDVMHDDIMGDIET